MIRVVSWNIAKRWQPWHDLVEMARHGEADVALLQEAGSPPPDLAHPVRYGNEEFWRRHQHEGCPIYDRWCLVVQLSDRVDVEWFRAVPPISELGEHDIGVSCIGTIAAAKATPRGQPEDEAFIAVSMYARWMKPHPSTKTSWRVGASDVSVHRILSDLSAFIGHEDPSRHRILAAGDLNMIYGATGGSLSLPIREKTVWDRMSALGLEFLGPQAPDGWQPSGPQPDVPSDTKNVPTWVQTGRNREEANRQFDYAIASRGLHNRVKVPALNRVDEWGPSDHCRLLIEIATE